METINTAENLISDEEISEIQSEFDLELDFDPDPLTSIWEFEAAEVNISDTELSEYASAGFGDFDDDFEKYLAELLPEEAFDGLAGEPDNGDVEPDNGADESYSRVGDTPKNYPQTQPLAQKIMAPIIALLAAAVVRRGGPANTPDSAETLTDEPEMPIKKAIRHYGRQIKPLKQRGRLAMILCVPLCYISLAHDWSLPMFGILSSDPRAAALVSLIIQLCVMMLGLDVFTNGIVSLLRLKPGLESLASVSCIISAADAAGLALNGTYIGLPYCSVSALAITFLIYSARLNCSALYAGLRAAARPSDPITVHAAADICERGAALVKNHGELTGFIRRSEYPDVSENAYTLFAPLFLVTSLALSAVSGISGGFSDFLHTFSGVTAASASFAGAISFSLPFCASARRLRRSGAAIAGSEGCVSAVKAKGLVVTDGEIFPPGTVTIGSVRLLEGVDAEKTISFTGSVISASGSCLTEPFSALLKRQNTALKNVLDFSPHDGGGFTAIIDGENVCVGNIGFMHLMGIRVSHSVPAKNCVFTAISGVLVGIFSIEYRASRPVRAALLTLLRGKAEPIFSVRDFIISPLLITESFKLKSQYFNFPPFTERFRISSLETAASGSIMATLSSDGLTPIAELLDTARRLQGAAKKSVTFSLISAALGMLVIFSLCQAKAYDSATSANLLIYMLISAFPIWLTNR